MNADGEEYRIESVVIVETLVNIMGWRFIKCVQHQSKDSLSGFLFRCRRISINRTPHLRTVTTSMEADWVIR